MGKSNATRQDRRRAARASAGRRSVGAAPLTAQARRTIETFEWLAAVETPPELGGCAHTLTLHLDGSLECPGALTGACPGHGKGHRSVARCPTLPVDALRVHTCPGCARGH